MKKVAPILAACAFLGLTACKKSEPPDTVVVTPAPVVVVPSDSATQANPPATTPDPNAPPASVPPASVPPASVPPTSPPMPPANNPASSRP